MNKLMDLGDVEIEALLENLDGMSPEELAEIDLMVDELANRKTNQDAYDDLLAFCKKMDPNYLVGRHHRILANMLTAIERGDKDRICVNMPPRHGKSQLVSIFYPAWSLGGTRTRRL